MALEVIIMITYLAQSVRKFKELHCIWTDAKIKPYTVQLYQLPQSPSILKMFFFFKKNPNDNVIILIIKLHAYSFRDLL